MPDPRRIRVLMGSFVMLGVWMGALGALLQLWSMHLRVGPVAASSVFLMLGLGSVATPLVAMRRGPTTGRTIQRLFVAAGILGATSFVWLSRIVDAFWLRPPLLVLGLALGTLVGATVLLLRATLTPARATAVIEMAGFFFSVGALSICVLMWLLFDRLGTILWLLALLLLLLAWRVRKSSLFAFVAFRPDSSTLWRQLDHSPTAFLLALALFLQSGIHWTLGGWLAFYLSRKLGTAGSTGVAILAGFWLLLTCGRVAAQRLPPLEKRLRWLMAASGLCFVGAVFLIQTVQVSGAVVGASCLGLGLGLLHPLTLGAVTSRHPDLQPRLVHTFFLATFSGALLVPWGVGHLAAEVGIEIVVWTALAAGILIFLLLAIVVVESKLDARAATTAP